MMLHLTCLLVEHLPVRVEELLNPELASKPVVTSLQLSRHDTLWFSSTSSSLLPSRDERVLIRLSSATPQ